MTDKKLKMVKLKKINFYKLFKIKQIIIKNMIKY